MLAENAAIAADSSAGQDAGMHIYREGLLPSGAVLRGVLRNGAELGGSDAACVKCHRRSGLGVGEGQKTIRPIAGGLLFSRPDAPATERASVLADGAQADPPYTVETLARALREGIAPSGRVLDELMPRFDMSDADVVQLAAYLRSLSQASALGVSGSEIHFATVVTPEVDPLRSKAMLDVMEAFFATKNAGTRGEGKRKAIGRERMYRSYRTWVLHVWKLEGAPETWAAQLESHYNKQPVFAMLSGIGTGNWRPVHEFCEQVELPCLFPNVDYPVISGSDYASLYFSRGTALEADVLAKHLSGSRYAGRIVQVFRDDPIGRVPAQTLRAALQRHGIDAVIDRPVTGQHPVTDVFWTLMLKEAQPGVLVLWLRDDDIIGLHGQGDAPPGMDNVYLSGSLITRPCNILMFDGWLNRMRLIYPFELTERRVQRLPRMKLWLEARNIPLLDERIQSSTYFAVTVAGDALSSMGENFSRDYFIERVEQMTEQSLSSAIYPRLTLGPGQRFASRGSYVARFPDEGEGESMLMPVSEWIVP